ncbi:MAG: ComF family protein [Bacteroidota bacterium]
MSSFNRKSNWTLVNAISDFIALFFPRCCLACSESLVKGEDILCTHCLTELPKTNYHLHADNPIQDRLTGRIKVKHAWAYMKFRKSGIVQHLLHQLKYNNHPEVGVRIGMAYGKELLERGFEKEFDLIVPVPLHQFRQRKRGYNQSAKFAEGLSYSLGVPWDESITIRKKHTATQTRKSKLDRWENVNTVFGIDSMDKILNQRILLVDDVITTGATLEACGQQLLEGNCKELSVACMAEAQ